MLFDKIVLDFYNEINYIRIMIKKIKKSEQYLREFELILKCETNSNQTIKNYMGALKSFLIYCQGKIGEPKELIQHYIVDKLNDKSPKTINLNRAAIVKFFKMIKKIDISLIDVPRKRQNKKLIKIVDKNIIMAVIKETKNLKHKLQLSLLYCCGLRLNELTNLKIENIISNNNNYLLLLNKTKGDKERIIPIPESIKILLLEFTKNKNNSDYIFSGQFNDNISKRSIQKIVKNSFIKYGVNVHPHMLRHTFATEQLNSGQDISKVQNWLGHENINTTMGYIHLNNKILSESTDLLRCI
jgi:site-specific recombinase XerD